jgi:hypothetical protein
MRGSIRHLRPALDLERAERVGLADHGVGARVLRRYRRKIEFDPLGGSQEIEGALHARQHPQGQAVDLHEAQGIDVVLVPFDDLAVDHRRRFDRRQFVQPVVRQNEATRVLREMPRRPHELLRQHDRQLQPPVAHVQIELLGMLGIDALLRPFPDLGREHLDEVFGQPQSLADIAHGALGPVAYHGRAEGGMVAAVGLEDPLHHLFAAFMLEVDVDVGRLAAFLGNEPLEQEVVAFGIDRCDAEDVADRGVGGRPPSLAQDFPAACEADDRVHGEEVRRIFEPLDQREFMIELFLHFAGQALGISVLYAVPGELLQGLLRRQLGHRPLFRILVGEFVQSERAAGSDLGRPGYGVRIARKKPGHLFRRLEVSVRMPLAPEADVVDGGAIPDARHDVLKDAPVRFVEEHVVGRDRRHAEARRHVRQVVDPQLVVRPAAQRQRHVGAVAEPVRGPFEPQRADLVGFVGDKDRDQTLPVLEDVLPFEDALGLAPSLLPHRKQTAQPRIGGPVRRVDQHRHAIDQIEPAADDHPDARDLGRFVRADDARERVAVDDRKALDADRGGMREQFLAGRRAPQEREVRRALELEIAHPKIP